MTDAVRFAIDSAFKNSNQIQPSPPSDESIHKNCFGVFVSFERSPLHRLRSNTDYVHGCIGDWTNTFERMETSKMVEVIKRVAYDACWKDSRGKLYKESIYTDMNAQCKVYFMLEKIKRIDMETGEIYSDGNKEDPPEYFDNNIFGVIVVSGNNRATYLPGVFSENDNSWKTIRNSLFQKASITSYKDSSLKLFAYKCAIQSMRILDYYVSPIHSFFDKIYSFVDFVPYAISPEEKEIETDKRQSVRNIATIYDFDLLQKYYKPFSHITQQKMADNIDYYIRLYEKEGWNQSSLFLLLYLYTHDKHIRIVQSILKETKEKFWSMEPDFEQSEALYVLSVMNEADDDFYQIFDRYEHNSSPPLSFTYTIHDIFRLNWHVKSLHREKHLSILLLLQDIVFRILEEYIPKNCKGIQFLETNYLVVMVECISTIKKILRGSYRKDFNEVFMCVYRELLDRRTSFFLFKDGSARIDITGHFLDSCYSFLDDR